MYSFEYMQTVTCQKDKNCFVVKNTSDQMKKYSLFYFYACHCLVPFILISHSLYVTWVQSVVNKTQCSHRWSYNGKMVLITIFLHLKQSDKSYISNFSAT